MNFKILRKRANLSQKQVAKILETSQSTIACWETGRAKPRADKLPALAKLFGCTIDELLETEVKA